MTRSLQLVILLLLAQAVSCDDGGHRQNALPDVSPNDQAISAIENMMDRHSDSNNPVAVGRLRKIRDQVAASGISSFEGKLHPVSVFANISDVGGPPEVLVFTFLTFDDLKPDRIVIQEADGTEVSHAMSPGRIGIQDEGQFGFGVIRLVIPALVHSVEHNKLVYARLYVGELPVSNTVEVDVTMWKKGGSEGGQEGSGPDSK